MKSFHGLAPQLRGLLPVIALIFATSFALIGAVVSLSRWTGVPMSFLTSDPAAINNTPASVGFVSNIGLFLWSATAAICLFSAALIAQSKRGTKQVKFLGGFGLLTLVLNLDDTFLLHERILPDHFGIPEEVVYLTYMGVTLCLLMRFRRQILEHEPLLLAFALCFFALSILTDVSPFRGPLPSIVEASTKLVGILSWLAYFSRTAARIVLTQLSRSTADNTRAGLPGDARV